MMAGSRPSATAELVASGVAPNLVNLILVDNSNNECGFAIERSAHGSTAWSQVAATVANSTAKVAVAVVMADAVVAVEMDK